MFESSRARTPHRRNDAPSAFFLRVTLLLVCALLSHSLDYCAAHIGLAHPARHIAAPCHDAGTLSCERCAGDHKTHSDGCDPSSEIAIRTVPAHHSVPPDIAVAVFAAPLPAAPRLIALSGSLHGKAEPPPRPFLSSACRLSLPDRAPPISA